MAYFVLFLYIFIVYLLSKSNRISKKAELLLMCLGLFSFISLRSPEIGTDTDGYCFDFIYYGKRIKSIKEILNMEISEKGFRVYMWLLYKIAPFEQALLIAHGVFVSFCFGRFLKRFSTDYFLSVVCFLTISFGFHLTGMRQSFAMCFCMLAYIKLMDKKYVQMSILALVGFTFHNSAIVFVLIVIYVLFWKKGNNLIATGILSVLTAVFMGRILPYLTVISDKWSEYSEIESTGNGFTFFVVLLAMEFVFWFVEKKMSDEGAAHKRISYLAVIFWAGRLVNRTFERPALFFFPAFQAEMPEAIAKLNDKDRALIRSLFIIGMCALYAYRFYGTRYSFFWQ